MDFLRFFFFYKAAQKVDEAGKGCGSCMGCLVIIFIIMALFGAFASK
jgi:hypothetical protein